MEIVQTGRTPKMGGNQEQRIILFSFLFVFFFFHFSPFPVLYLYNFFLLFILLFCVLFVLDFATLPFIPPRLLFFFPVAPSRRRMAELAATDYQQRYNKENTVTRRRPQTPRPNNAVNTTTNGNNIMLFPATTSPTAKQQQQQQQHSIGDGRRRVFTRSASKPDTLIHSDNEDGDHLQAEEGIEVSRDLDLANVHYAATVSPPLLLTGGGDGEASVLFSARKSLFGTTSAFTVVPKSQDVGSFSSHPLQLGSLSEDEGCNSTISSSPRIATKYHDDFLHEYRTKRSLFTKKKSAFAPFTSPLALRLIKRPFWGGGGRGGGGGGNQQIQHGRAFREYVDKHSNDRMEGQLEGAFRDYVKGNKIVEGDETDQTDTETITVTTDKTPPPPPQQLSPFSCVAASGSGTTNSGSTTPLVISPPQTNQQPHQPHSSVRSPPGTTRLLRKYRQQQLAQTPASAANRNTTTKTLSFLSPTVRRRRRPGSNNAKKTTNTNTPLRLLDSGAKRCRRRLLRRSTVRATTTSTKTGRPEPRVDSRSASVAQAKTRSLLSPSTAQRLEKELQSYRTTRTGGTTTTAITTTAITTTARQHRDAVSPTYSCADTDEEAVKDVDIDTVVAEGAEVLPVPPVEPVTATAEDTTSITLEPTITAAAVVVEAATKIPPSEAAVVSSAEASSVVVSVPAPLDVVAAKDTTTIPAEDALTTTASKAVEARASVSSASWPLVVDTDTQEKKEEEEEVPTTTVEAGLAPIEDIFHLKDMSNEVEVRYSPQALGAAAAAEVAGSATTLSSTSPPVTPGISSGGEDGASRDTAEEASPYDEVIANNKIPVVHDTTTTIAAVLVDPTSTLATTSVPRDKSAAKKQIRHEVSSKLGSYWDIPKNDDLDDTEETVARVTRRSSRRRSRSTHRNTKPTSAREMVGAKEDGQSVIVSEADDVLPTAEGRTAAVPPTKPDDDHANYTGKEHEAVGRVTRSRSRGKSIHVEPQVGVQEGTKVLKTHQPDEDEDVINTNKSAAVDRPPRNRSPTATVRNAMHDQDDDVDESIDYDVTCGIFRSLSRASTGSSSDTTTSQSDNPNTSRRHQQRRKSMQDAMKAISAAEFVITGRARAFCSQSSSSPTRDNTTTSQDCGTTSSGDDTSSSHDTSIPSSKGSLQSLWDSLPTACGRSSMPDDDEDDTATNTAVSPSCSLDAHRLTCVNPVATTLMQLWNEQQQRDTTTSSTTTASTMNDEKKLEEDPPILPASTTASSSVTTTTTPTTSFEDPTIHISPTPLTPPKREFSCDLKQVYGFDRVANLTLQRPTPVQATAGATAATPGTTPLDRLFTCIE